MAVQLPLECLQCGRAHGLPGQLVPLPYCSNSQEAFPDVQPESGFLSLEPIIPCPALWEDQEEMLALLGVRTFQVLEECYHASPQSSLFQTKHAQFFQSLP